MNEWMNEWYLEENCVWIKYAQAFLFLLSAEQHGITVIIPYSIDIVGGIASNLEVISNIPEAVGRLNADMMYFT